MPLEVKTLLTSNGPMSLRTVSEGPPLTLGLYTLGLMQPGSSGQFSDIRTVVLNPFLSGLLLVLHRGIIQ